jgi:hypothetical protein
MSFFDIQLKHQAAALALVVEGMRIPLVHAMTGISYKQLSCVWRSAHGVDAILPGRGAVGILPYLKGTQNQRLHMFLSTLVGFYFSIEKIHPRISQAEAFLLAWRSRWFFIDNEEDVDINVAWYAIRDLKATELYLERCKRCHSTFIYDLKIAELSRCPFCKQQN